MEIELKNITKRFSDIVVIDNFSLKLSANGTVCIFGPSGCGKTTLVNILAGILKPDSGEIIGIDDRTNVSFVFQDDRLIPWITVKENIKSVIKSKDSNMVADDILESVGLKEFAYKNPDELSGGMRRKVSIARALVYDSDILILDEPLKGLDSNSKDNMMDLIMKKRENKPNILITHSINEALALSDKIYVFSNLPLNLKGYLEINLSYEKKLGNKKFLEEYREKLIDIINTL